MKQLAKKEEKIKATISLIRPGKVNVFISSSSWPTAVMYKTYSKIS